MTKNLPDEESEEERSRGHGLYEGLGCYTSKSKQSSRLECEKEADSPRWDWSSGQRPEDQEDLWIVWGNPASLLREAGRNCSRGVIWRYVLKDGSVYRIDGRWGRISEPKLFSWFSNPSLKWRPIISIHTNSLQPQGTHTAIRKLTSPPQCLPVLLSSSTLPPAFLVKISAC